MLPLLRHRDIFRRSVCLILTVSLCCIPLFGFSRADSIELPPKDSIVVDDTDSFELNVDYNYDMYEVLAGLDLSDETLEILAKLHISSVRLRELAELNLDNDMLAALVELPTMHDSSLNNLETSFGFVPYERLANEALSRPARNELWASGIADGYPEPDAFGGLYLDDNGILVINLVDDDAQLKEEIACILGDAKYYTQSVTYSWNYLYEIQDLIFEYIMQGSEGILKDNLNSLSLDDRYNVIIVGLEDPSEEAITYFKEHVIDSPAVSFEQIVIRYALVLVSLNLNKRSKS